MPASVLALLDDLSQAGYLVSALPSSPRALLDSLDRFEFSMTLTAYRDALAQSPASVGESVTAAWGAPETDPDVLDGAFHFRARSFGNIVVALPPDRGRSSERRADYHDPSLPPRHALMAFGLWLRNKLKADAIVHMGAHGTLEWLPGKAVALTASCFPEAVMGPLPVNYPFIVSNPGEAAQAKRRLAALTLGHLPPPLVGADLSGDARELERLVDEYAQADGLDRRRRERLARLIAYSAQRSGLAREAGVDTQASPDEALRRIDAWLCDLKDLAVKDGQHIYGRAPDGADASRVPARRTNAAACSTRSTAGASRRGRRVRRIASAATCCRPAQYVHRRSADAADTDRDGPWPDGGR